GIVGAGMMGADHVKRITSTISGARVSAVVDPDQARLASALENAPGATGYSRIEDALEAGAVDGVLIATPGFLHEQVLLPCLAAGVPILCEKPLTTDPESSWRVLGAEPATGRQLIQVGFMRRFDPEYRQLRELIVREEAGQVLMLRCGHRSAARPGRLHATLRPRLPAAARAHRQRGAPPAAHPPLRPPQSRGARLVPAGIADQRLGRPRVRCRAVAGGLADRRPRGQTR